MVRWIRKRQPLTAIIGLLVLASVGMTSMVVFSRPTTMRASFLPQTSDDKNTKVSVGGVMRPQRDTQKHRKSKIKEDRAGKDLDAEAKEQFDAMPKQAALELTAHPTVAKVHEKLKKGDHQSISLHTEPVAFDRQAYEAAKKEYLEDYVPNRIFQTAQPSDGVPALAAKSSTWQQMASGESIRLEVTSAPNLPVTFLALDLGAFENKLNAITVEANGKGVAMATYTATPGTIGRSHIIAGSPGASGQVSFEVMITSVKK